MNQNDHPVLDHSAKLREAIDEYGLTSPETQWRGWREKHLFVCAHGHGTPLKPVALTRRVWAGCAECRKILGLMRIQHAAMERGGVCLSDTYAGTAARYRFRCAEGHEWNAFGSGVLNGGWCDICAAERLRLADGLAKLRRQAIKQGGVCLTDTYDGIMQLYRFRCADHHEWETHGWRILRGVWCQQCSFDRKRLGIEAAIQTAAGRGGECLSTEYRNNSTKLTWKCHRGHVWHAVYGSVRAGTWCPECARLARIVDPRSKALRKYVSGAAPPGDSGC